jgi:hypothetical protein
MGYLVCEKCGGYYELQPGESPDEFKNKCECGGDIKYVKNLEGQNKNLKEIKGTKTCPLCGAQNPEDATICKSCKRLFRGAAPYEGDKKNSVDGAIETWNNQTNIVKALSIIGVCCIGLLLIVGIAGMFTPDKNTTGSVQSSPTQTTTTPSNQNPSDQNDNVVVTISATSSWQGNIGDKTGSRSIEGSGSQTFNLGASPGYVSVAVSKGFNSTGTLTVQILRGNKVVETQSTSAEAGMVTLSHGF